MSFSLLSSIASRASRNDQIFNPKAMANPLRPNEDHDIFALELSSYSSTDSLDLVDETSTNNILSPTYWTADSSYAGSDVSAQPGAATVHESMSPYDQTYEDVDLEGGCGVPTPIVRGRRHNKTATKRRGILYHCLKYICIGLVILCGILSSMIFLGWVARWASNKNAAGTHP